MDFGQRASFLLRSTASGSNPPLPDTPWCGGAGTPPHILPDAPLSLPKPPPFRSYAETEATIESLKWVAGLCDDPIEKIRALRMVFELRRQQLEASR